MVSYTALLEKVRRINDLFEKISRELTGLSVSTRDPVVRGEVYADLTRKLTLPVEERGNQLLELLINAYDIENAIGDYKEVVDAVEKYASVYRELMARLRDKILDACGSAPTIECIEGVVTDEDLLKLEKFGESLEKLYKLIREYGTGITGYPARSIIEEEIESLEELLE